MLQRNIEDSVKKKLILTTIGIGLQTVGTICLAVSMIGISREINLQIKSIIRNELLKYTEE